jgi:uncharacterized protein YegL
LITSIILKIVPGSKILKLVKTKSNNRGDEMLKLQILLTLLIFSCASLDIDTDDKDGHWSVKYPKNSRSHAKEKSKHGEEKEEHGEEKDGEKVGHGKKKFGSAHENFEAVGHTSAESTINELQEHDDEDSNFALLQKDVSSGLRAGYTNDAKQYNNFILYLKKYKSMATSYDLAIEERLLFHVKDKGGRPIINAQVKVYADNALLVEGKTYADGTYTFYPSQFSKEAKEYKVVVTKGKDKLELKVDRFGKRQYSFNLDADNKHLANIPLDIVFILDTTGSMGEEIEQLRNSIEIINLNLSLITKSPIRYGLVLYRDKDDEYITREVAFTSNLEKFKQELSTVVAKGGGDKPEDLQTALKVAIKDLKWNPDALKVGFIITDAGPHLDYKQEYTYVNAVKDATTAGIKLFSVGAGGLDINGEYVLRQISQYTDAKYIYLARKEGDHASPGESEHHEGAATHFDRLETIVLRFTKEELNYAKAKQGEESENIIIAKAKEGETKDDTIQRLFDFAVNQLIDYSTVPIDRNSNTSTLPISYDDSTLKPASEYLGEQLLLSTVKLGKFKVMDRKELSKVLSEWSLKQSLGVDENAFKFGKLLGAKFLVNSKLYKKGKDFELYLKLLDVETGEVLSATKLVIQKEIGI